MTVTETDGRPYPDVDEERPYATNPPPAITAASAAITLDLRLTDVQLRLDRIETLLARMVHLVDIGEAAAPQVVEALATVKRGGLASLLPLLAALRP